MPTQIQEQREEIQGMIIEQQQEDEHDEVLIKLHKRQDLMFASQFRAKPARKSLLDFPSNFRQMIYNYALFDEKYVA